MTQEWVKAPDFDEKLAAAQESSTGEEAPKRRGRPPGSKNRIQGERRPGRPRASLKEPIGGMLVMLNLPIQMLAPGDALDPAEIDALAIATDEQCRTSPRFRKYVERMLGVASGGQLLVVGGMIIGRRAARHGVLGPNGETVDRALGMQLQAMTGEQAVVPTYAPAPETQSEPVQDEGSNGAMPAVGGTTIT